MIQDRLARNAVWNLLSLATPMLVALVAIPALIQALGADRFGVLTLAWMLIGYCSLFDLGLGRALTKLVAECGVEQVDLNRLLTVGQASWPVGLAGSALQNDRPGGLSHTEHSIASTVWTSLALMLALGCGGALIFAAGAPLLANSVLNIPTALRSETIVAFRWIAAGIPLVTLTAGLRGILEAQQRFGSLSIVRALTGALTFIGPLAAAKLSGGLAAVVFTLVALRLLSLVAHGVLSALLTPELLADRRFRFTQVGPLFRFGGWLTVSNLLSPLMVSMDRFLVGMFLSVSEVAYYATPYEIVTKLQVIPAAITGVLFPAFSGALANDRDRARRLYTRGLWAVVGALAPLVTVLALFAHLGLRLWLGEEFASHGYHSLQLLAIGVLINCAAFVPSSFLHAAGRPDVNAKLHMIEFPLYVPLVCSLIHFYGIEGAALAWVLRVTLDAGLLFWMATRSMPASAPLRWETANAAPAATRAIQ